MYDGMSTSTCRMEPFSQVSLTPKNTGLETAGKTDRNSSMTEGSIGRRSVASVIGAGRARTFRLSVGTQPFVFLTANADTTSVCSPVTGVTTYPTLILPD